MFCRKKLIQLRRREGRGRAVARLHAKEEQPHKSELARHQQQVSASRVVMIVKLDFHDMNLILLKGLPASK
jgi:hypothetical protein